MAENVSTFRTRGPAERRGVERSLEFLRANTRHASVEDMQGNEAAQRAGYDLVWRTKEGAKVLIDVKGDTKIWKSGNYAIELVSVVEKGVPGNFVTSTADVWHYHDLVGNVLHILDLEKLRAFFFAIKDPLRPFKTKTERGEGYHTWGLLLPVEWVRQAAPDALLELPLQDPPTNAWKPFEG